jgi:4'-phosphopantetheinyl transferase
VKNQRTRIGKSGKPYLISGELYFNVSHTKEFVICAISDNPIGADIETIDPKLKAMTTGFLSANEQLKYKHSSHVVLTKIWASKEAIVKLLGTGLTKRLSTIELDNLYTSAKRINVITLK